MRTSDFDYELPEGLIAREPMRPRDASRMMVLSAKSGGYIDSRFTDLPNFLNASDVLVLNDTRVIRSRMRGRLHRQNNTFRDMEVFFAEPIDERRWRVLCRPGRRIRPGDRVDFQEFYGVFQESCGNDLYQLELIATDSIAALLQRHGEIPLPPYLNRNETPSDATDYQTVFAHSDGAVAAPTAGLHFTEDMLERITGTGITIVNITLHVGIGTFLPVRSEKPEEHVLRAERFEISEEAGSLLRSAKKEGRRIVAVGTTTTRTLEYVVSRYGELRAASGEADVFILPGFRFKAIDALLTNFHLPRSTLLMLVAAIAGREAILSAYAHAVAEQYRFYSYGDCMLVTR